MHFFIIIIMFSHSLQFLYNKRLAGFRKELANEQCKSNLIRKCKKKSTNFHLLIYFL